jgi:hypothetical protein
MEGHRGPPGGLDPGTGHLEDLGVHVYADDLTLRADQVGQEQGDVTGAAADVEHLHPRRDARCGQELAGERAVELVLEDEPSRLGIGATQRIAVCGLGRQPVHVDILPRHRPGWFRTGRPEWPA